MREKNYKNKIIIIIYYFPSKLTDTVMANTTEYYGQFGHVKLFKWFPQAKHEHGTETTGFRLLISYSICLQGGASVVLEQF